MTIDILRFVGSPDVRQHMRDIGYQPSTPEAAFLVWHCHDATLQERFAAWEQIIATMPNCGYQTKRLEIEISDFHEFLHRYIALQKRLLENFKKPDGCLFIPGLRACQRAGGQSWGLYDTFERCVTAVVEDARESRCLAGSHDGCCPEMCPGGSFQDDVYERYIVKRRIDDGDDLGEDECSINAAGEVLRLDCRSGLSDDEVNLDMAFCEMLFKFPLPFHAGDILFDWHYGGAPYVLTEVRLWGTEEKRRENLSLESSEERIKAADKNLARYLAQGGAEYIDGYGYVVEDSGNGEPYIFDDGFGMHDMLNAAYCNRPLSGKYRLLKPVSEYLKGNIDVGAVANAAIALTQRISAENRMDALRSEYAPSVVAGLGLAEKPQDGQDRMSECLNRTDCLFITAAVPGQSARRACEQRQLLRTEIRKSGLVHCRARGRFAAASGATDAAEADAEVFLVANSRFSPLDFITLATHWCGMFGQKSVLVTCPEHVYDTKGAPEKGVEAEANFYDERRDVAASRPYVAGETAREYFAGLLGEDFAFTASWRIWKDGSICRCTTNLMSASCGYHLFKHCYPGLDARAWNPYNHKPVPDGAWPRHLFASEEQ